MFYKKDEMLIDCFFSIAMIVLIVVFVLFGKSSLYGKNYFDGVKLIELINFDDLQTSTLSDGAKIKVSPSAEYPADKIVTYKNIVFPVENHNGKSKAVAIYSPSIDDNTTLTWIVIIIALIILLLMFLDDIYSTLEENYYISIIKLQYMINKR